MDLDPLTRSVLIDIANKRIQQQEAKLRDREEKVKLDMAYEAAKVKLPFDAPSSLKNLMNF